ncbi:reticulon-like protein b11 [Phtheirospermum japonicum]|uniref:Reticulon-like protein n=1 Tax=Phtheirospermum japonicum TaxID=374723 RepID=A0A830DPQ2_9LAMI|nr:reticulon-like protein b11 [Phtheirospermum japonicum]
MAEPRRCSVHLALGGGAVADVFLWKKWYRSSVLLVSSTFIWFLFVRAGYNLLSFISNALFLLAVILFFWAKSASLLNRPPPPLPSLELSEEIVVKAADEMRVWVNYALSIAHDIAIGGNLRLFGQLAIGLWVISIIGSFFDFLTLVYIGVLLCLSLPILYDKHQDVIDEKLNAAYKVAQIQFHIIEEKLQNYIPLPSNKEKKTQ